MKKVALHNEDATNIDLILREKALAGDRNALGELIENHRDFIFNVVWKIVLNPADAEDITQDVIVKIITNLSSFRGESNFRTWLYRIAFNHILNLKKRPMENVITSFEDFGMELDRIPNSNFPEDNQPTPEDLMVIEEVKLSCTSGMLMCLDRQQRLIYILGDIFEINHNLGAEILEISRDNYRQKLSRARKQLVNFMQDKCGLINKDNPCRCRKKTRAFINEGLVDPANLKFNAFHKKKIFQTVNSSFDKMESNLEEHYAKIYRDHPYQEKSGLKENLYELINSKDFKLAFNLN